MSAPAAAGPSGRPALAVGPGRFDPATGRLGRLGDLALEGPRLDVWRAPTDNDNGMHGPEQLGTAWRHLGLHRARHRTIALEESGDGLVVRTRVGFAAWDGGLLATYTWTPEGEGLLLRVDVAPEGEWPFPLPRLGVRLALPAGLDRVEWFGRGPGEAYPDTRRAARVGRFAASVDELQTPYVQAAGERQPDRGALGDLHRRTGRGPTRRGPPAHRDDGQALDERGPRRRDPHARARRARPDLGQPRSRPPGDRDGLLRARRAPAAPAPGRPGDVRDPLQPGRPFARVTSAYQRALSFGVRSSVSKSTWMSPKRFVLPNAHSKLSISDQTK